MVLVRSYSRNSGRISQDGETKKPASRKGVPKATRTPKKKTDEQLAKEAEKKKREAEREKKKAEREALRKAKEQEEKTWGLKSLDVEENQKEIETYEPGNPAKYEWRALAEALPAIKEGTRPGLIYPAFLCAF